MPLMHGLEHAGLLYHVTIHMMKHSIMNPVYEPDICFDLCSCFTRFDTTAAKPALAHVASFGFTSWSRVSANAMTSLVRSNAQPQIINTTFADGNRGLQAGTITGHFNAEFHHHAPGRPSTRPTSHASDR